MTARLQSNNAPVPRLPIFHPSGEVLAWPGTFDDLLSTDAWQAVHVKPRQEKKLAADAQRMGFAGCLFLERRVRVYPGKGKQVSLVPLLGPYLFLAAPREIRFDLYRTERCVRILEVPMPALLSADLRNLRTLIKGSTTPLLVRPEIVAGNRVTIRSGTLAGVSGTVSERKGLAMLVINLPLLGTSVSTTLPADWAELAQPA